MDDTTYNVIVKYRKSNKKSFFKYDDNKIVTKSDLCSKCPLKHIVVRLCKESLFCRGVNVSSSPRRIPLDRCSNPPKCSQNSHL